MLDIQVDEHRRRQEIHEQYGGSPQGGICPSGKGPYIFLFTDHTKGPQYGYRDGWGTDGYYHYCGAGRHGDQQITRGNKAVLEHTKTGKSLHLFEGIAAGVVAYRGEFALASDKPWYRTEAPDVEGIQRSAIMFRLMPVDASSAREPRINRIPASQTEVETTPVERNLTPTTSANRSKESIIIKRRESELVGDYRDHLVNLGHQVSRFKIRPQGESNSLLTDLYDATTDTLIEAKSAATREAIRTAIGQLFDYQRFITPTPSLAILTPSEPRKDLRDLCAALSIQTIWRTEQGYASSETSSE
ncbi:restriction endonuclease [Streptomyces sp. PR69]|uniref:restriction endonuclease n=1 Tax=Streptomyces sp. PR69 TaxID=2984950 RepID=UPI002264FFB9|nr:restriction endonuclease [Streptomyces sp. PR69]